MDNMGYMSQENSDVTQTTAETSKGTPAPETLSNTPDPDLAKEVARDFQFVLDGEFPETRDKIREMLNVEEMLPSFGLSLEESRANITGKLQQVMESGLPRGVFKEEQGGTGETGPSLTSIEMLGHVDLSLMVKAGVQWGLFGGAVGNLGTERHQQMVTDLMNLDALGCFAMTERGHGSDVQSLETTAHYDPETKEFILNSPTASSEKFYIGNAARDGRWAAVFCQLYTNDSEESKGVHCILARIREDDGSPVEGVRIGDHGFKGGLAGVDNGTMMFDNYRVPHEALLNRFADVDEEGNYSSPIENPNRRFFTMLGALVRGRVTVGAAAGSAARTALDIATTYANLRRQFASDDSLPENKLIEHRKHRLRLIPAIAKSYGLQLATNKLISRVHELDQLGIDPTNMSDKEQADQRELEAHAAALKAANTRHATDTIQDMREACGGAGYMAENYLTTLKGDSDVFTTFEGDDTILRQLVGKNLLTAYGWEVSEMSPFGMAKFVVSNIGDILTRRSGIAASVQSLSDRVTGTGSLFDADTQLRIVQAREEHVLNSLVRRVQVARKMERKEAAEVINRAQDHLLEAAVAYGDRMLVQAMIEAEEVLPENSSARSVYEQLRHLFVLNTIVEKADWYQEHGVLPSGRVKAAKAAVNDLVDSLAPWSEVLVDAFKIPQVVLDRPMMSNGGTDLS